MHNPFCQKGSLHICGVRSVSALPTVLCIAVALLDGSNMHTVNCAHHFASKHLSTGYLQICYFIKYPYIIMYCCCCCWLCLCGCDGSSLVPRHTWKRSTSHLHPIPLLVLVVVLLLMMVLLLAAAVHRWCSCHCATASPRS